MKHQDSALRNPQSAIVRVLLVEDDPGYARLIWEILKEASAGQFELAHAERLDEGLKRLGEEAFDVMLLDLNLLDSQGLDTFVRAHAQAPEVPIVVLTGLADEVLGVRAIQGGAQDYLVKGQVDGNLLVRALRYAIERKRAEQEIRQRTAQLEALREVGLELTAQLDLDALLRSIVSRAIELLGGTSGGLYLYRPEQDVLEWAVSLGPNLAPTGTVLHRGEGLSGRVWETGEPLIVDDYQHWDGHAAVYEGYPWTAVVGVPVRWGKEFLGVLDVLADSPRTFSPADADLLSLFTTQATIAIRNARLLQAEREQRELTERLRETALLVSSSLELQEVLELILDQLARVIPYDSGTIQILEPDATRVIAAWNLRGEVLGHRHPLDQYPYNRRLAQGEGPIVIRDVREDSQGFVISDEVKHVRANIGVPLWVRDRVTGILTIDSRQPGVYTEADAQVAQAFAQQAAIAIENARLYEQARQEIVERKRAEEALHYRLAFDQLITNISTLFIQLAPDDLDSGIDFALQAIAKFTAVDRSYIFVFSDDGTKMDNTHQWCAEGIASQVENRRDLPVQRFPWWMERLDRLQAVHIPRVADLPPEAWAEKEFLESQAVQSLVAVPMVYSASLVGFVGFDSVRVEETWTEDIITLLKIVGDIFVNALVRKRAEEEREKLIKELDAFAHTVAHDLKSPLCTIVSFADMLEEDYATIPDGERQECLQMIVQGGHKAVSIIDELLLLAGVRKMEEVEMGPLDMASIVAEAQQRLARMIEEHRAEIVLPDTWPAATGYGPWVEEVWVNYLSNAIKYGGQPPRVELGASPPSVPPASGGEAKGGRMVRFWVRDNGPGLTPEEQARLFTLFTRLDQVRAKGHGLGLSIVGRIVEKLGGQVGVESEAGRGSVFTFTLPATDTEH